MLSEMQPTSTVVAAQALDMLRETQHGVVRKSLEQRSRHWDYIIMMTTMMMVVMTTRSQSRRAAQTNMVAELRLVQLQLRHALHLAEAALVPSGVLQGDAPL